MTAHSALSFLLAGQASWNPLAFDPGTTALSFIVFFITLFILTKFGWKPLLNAVEQREKKIKDSLNAAEEAAAGAEKARQEVEDEMRRARAEAQQIVEESRNAAKAVARDIEEKARSESEALKERATLEIEQLTQKAREDIRREAVELALKAASEVIGRSLEDADHRRIAEEAIKEVAV